MCIYLTKRSLKRLERMSKFHFQTKSKSKQKPKAILNSKKKYISMVVFKVASYSMSRFCS